MGREVKRVPIDFDWPIRKVWNGYKIPDELNPEKCPDCSGLGVTSAREWLRGIAYLIPMLSEYRNTSNSKRFRGGHPYLSGLQTTQIKELPSSDIDQLVSGLCGERSIQCCSSSYAVTNKIIEAAGLDPKTWGICQTCSGNGRIWNPGQKEKFDQWEPIEPPFGDGWQLWENVSEGSPISPVFPSSDLLVKWIEINEAPQLSIQCIERFVDAGWAPSMTCDSSGLRSGIALYE